MSDTIVRMEKITKVFPGVIALDSVDFDLMPGEIHALVGKNGAGKSTLINIISGVYIPDKGKVYYDGEQITYSHIQTLPVATVYQESTLFPNLTIADNIFSGNEPTTSFLIVNKKKKIERTRELLELFRLNYRPLTPVLKLSPAEQKVIEILRALNRKCRILILDEPTAALTLRETERLFELIRSVRETNVGIIYISHRLEEIFQVADRVTVLRDGKLQGREKISSINMNKLIDMMVGKKVELERIRERKPSKEFPKDQSRLQVKSLNHYFHRFKDITFTVYQKEIMGIVGLVGSGKSELARTLFGLEKTESGIIILDNKKISISNPKEAIKHGIVYVTENRKEEGLFLEMTLRDNISAPILDKVVGKLGILNNRQISILARDAIKNFDIRSTGTEQIANTLSGGNQQKVLLGTWLQLRPKVLIVDEPTVGIDVSAKSEIYKLLRNIAKSGTSIILTSSEIKEVVNNADRIITIYNGKKTGEFYPHEIDEGKILEYISGIVEEAL